MDIENEENAQVKQEEESSKQVETPVSYLLEPEDENAGGGLAAALALARRKGLMEGDRHLHGRANDKRTLKNNESFGGRKMDTHEINLRYLNEDGDEMTPREAYRHLSHYVHGTFPSKNRVEKEMKKKKEEQRMLKMSSTDTPLNTARKAQEAMKKSGSAYIEVCV